MNGKKAVVLSVLVLCGGLSGCALFSPSKPLSPEQEAIKQARENNSRPFIHPEKFSEAKILTELGSTYLRYNRPRMAIKEFKKVIKKNPAYSEVYLPTAVAYSRVKDYNKANKYLKKALSTSKSPEYLNDAGVIYKEEGRYRSAIRYFVEAADDHLYSTPEFALTNAAESYYLLKDYPMSIKLAERSNYLYPNYGPTIMVLAKDYRLMHRYAASEGLLQSLISDKYVVAESYLELGKDYRDSGDVAGQVKAWTHCVDAGPFSSYGEECEKLISED